MRGWSIEECAEKIGISARYLSDIERGDKVPKMETFVQILNILSASADDVLQDSLVIRTKAKEKNIKMVGHMAGIYEITMQLSVLDFKQRRQALTIMEAVITSLKEKEPS